MPSVPGAGRMDALRRDDVAAARPDLAPGVVPARDAFLRAEVVVRAASGSHCRCSRYLDHRRPAVVVPPSSSRTTSPTDTSPVTIPIAVSGSMSCQARTSSSSAALSWNVRQLEVPRVLLIRRPFGSLLRGAAGSREAACNMEQGFGEVLAHEADIAPAQVARETIRATKGAEAVISSGGGRHCPHQSGAVSTS